MQSSHKRGRHYDNWLKAYVHHTRYSESPDSFHFWAGVSTIAGALRRRVWIDQLHFQWTPNFYIVLVGPPGVAAKSTSIRAGLQLLEQVPGIFFGPQSMTWQALAESLQNAQEVIKIPGLDAEAVQSAITIGISELGTFLKPSDQELVDLLVAMWDGQKEVWRRQTKTQGETIIHNPWLNVIGCTTPAWLKANFPDVLIGGGLTSRVIFVFADKKRQLVAYPADHIPHASYKQEEAKLIDDLAIISSICGEYRLHPDAKVWGENWYELHWTSPRPLYMASDRFSGYIARKQTHLHKLAMVLAAAKRNDLLVLEEDLVEANTCITSIEQDMQQVFSSIGVSHTAAVSTEILALIRNHGQIPYKDLWRLCFSTMAAKDFTEALKSAKEAGFLKVETKAGEQVITYTGPKKKKRPSDETAAE